MKAPRLSIIVLTCNQCHFTLRLLESMAGYLLSRAEDVELILVDNGSTDGTADKVGEWVRLNCITNLRTIISPENLGVARGRNLGLSAATGSALMLLDNDTIACAETFNSLLEYVESNLQCGVAAPALYSPSGELQASAKPYPGILLKLSHIVRPGKELPREHEELEKLHPFYVIGACQILRRDVLTRVGLLDQKIFYGPEDADFCIRVRNAGYTIDYLRHLSLTHDWQRATRRSPFGKLGRLHIKALLHFWLRYTFRH